MSWYTGDVTDTVTNNSTNKALFLSHHLNSCISTPVQSEIHDSLIYRFLPNNFVFVFWKQWFMWLNVSLQFNKLNTFQEITNLHRVFLTFDSDLGYGLDHAQGGYGHTGIVGRLSDVGELQDVAANWHLLFLGQLHLTTHPLDIWHGSTNRNTGQVDAATRHHLVTGRGDGETGRYTTNCKVKERGWEDIGEEGWDSLDHWDELIFYWPGLYCATVVILF